MIRQEMQARKLPYLSFQKWISFASHKRNLDYAPDDDNELKIKHVDNERQGYGFGRIRGSRQKVAKNTKGGKWTLQGSSFKSNVLLDITKVIF